MAQRHLFSIILILGSIGSINRVQGTGTFHINRRSTAALFEPEEWISEEHILESSLSSESVGDEEEKEKESDAIHFEDNTSGIIWSFVILGVMYGILVLGTFIMCLALKREEAKMRGISRSNNLEEEPTMDNEDEYNTSGAANQDNVLE